jgi:2,4-dienoyl-CoA reductase-like NADH-dependent reductase (Old Yellow Enzyme family)
MTQKSLFEPYALGPLALSNRIVLAPLARNRAGAGFVPNELAAAYYSHRASAGLLISEGKADLFALGRAFIANPDLVERLKIGAPLANLNPATLHGGGAAGYIDYPALADANAD